MEAVAKLPLISFELKNSTENTHFGPKLKQYISEAYREDPDSYNNEVHQLESLRSAAVRPSNDSAGLSSMIRYLCQLRTLQSRFPMAKGQPAACTFGWRDLYACMNGSQADVRFEMAAILYNIGALHSELGASEPRTTPDSLKAACTHFQSAAWAFQYVREQYPQPPGIDTGTEIMRLLQEISFAQAQECILYKSIQDTKKPSVIGAVAAQVLLFYKNSLTILGPSSGTDTIYEIIGSKLYNYWYRSVAFRIAYIGCIVCLYQGMQAEEQQKMGERVAFYQLAVEKLNEARKLAKYIEPVQITQEALTFTNDFVEGKKKAAKNENEFIYHEEVPEKDLLMDIKPVCLVKGISINFDDPEVTGTDVFSRLVPMGAHEASSVYSEQKAQLLRQVMNKVEAKNTDLLEFMSSLQLDQLEVLDSDQKIPQEIIDRCAAMNAKSDIIQTLVDSMNSLAEIINDVEHTLAEIKSLIQEETLKEKEYQKIMGPRPPSIVQTELSREYHKYQEAHSRTNESNQVLHKAMTLHITNLRLLSQPLEVLESKIPSIDNIEGIDRDTMSEMRRVVGKCREMQTQRESLVQSLREDMNNDDITAKLLANTNATDEVFKQELDKHTPQIKIIEQNLTAQENIINKLTSLYASYGESRRLLSDVLRKREGLINALVTSYDTHEELLGKSQKGVEFYRKLRLSAGQLLPRVKSACQVQQEEREQLLSKQQERAASSAPPAAKSPEPMPVGGGPAPRKLKDYLPYMKNRSRGVAPQAPIEPVMPHESYYPDTFYPTSVRPAPLGSEATDIKIPDGMSMPPSMQNSSSQLPYNRYGTPDNDPYANNYGYPASNKLGMDKPTHEMNYGYNSPYTPSQFPTQIANSQYSNPQYSSNQENATFVTDSQYPSYSNQGHANTSQGNVYNPYINQNQVGPIPDVITSMQYTSISQAELHNSFAQMHVSSPRSEPSYEMPPNYGADYSQTYYNLQYPQTLTPNMAATYSHAIPNSNTSIVQSQVPSDYSSLSYPYNVDSINQYGQPNSVSNVPNVSAPYNVDPQYSYGTSGYDTTSQGYPVYTNVDSNQSYSTIVMATATTTSPSYTYTNEPDKINPAVLSQLDAMDEPIKSHATGQAISSDYSYQMNYQNFEANKPAFTNTTENAPAASNDQGQTTVNYAQVYQNHPGYSFNPATGSYDYVYGSQNCQRDFGNVGVPNVGQQTIQNDPNWQAHGVYTSAGGCETVQSPSGNPPDMPQTEQTSDNQNYHNNPYGYQSNMIQQNEVVPNVEPVSTNYGANQNQSTYMQSGQGHDTSVTFTGNQVATPVENLTTPPSFDQNQGYINNQSIPYNNDKNNSFVSNQNVSYSNVQNPGQNNSQYYQSNTPSQSNESYVQQNIQAENQSVAIGNEKVAQSIEPSNQPDSQLVQSKQKVEPVADQKIVVKPEPETSTQELSSFDLLSDIDFSVKIAPLMPEIKVPQISESALKRFNSPPDMEPVKKPVIEEEVIERPAKRDLFSDPGLLNKFTQEVKKLQSFTDSLTKRLSTGITVLDTKWQCFQDVQAKGQMGRSKSMAIKHSPGNIVTEVVPYDDSRVSLSSNPEAYVNASQYKQLSSWCIPLVLSKTPEENENTTFWKAIFDMKIACIVCLVTEIEMQGQSYWPTAIGQTLEMEGLSVTLEEVTCNVHWTERRLSITDKKSVLDVTHYQITVFPAKIVCSPIILLADKILSQTYDNMLSNQLRGAWLHCAGSGRSAVVSVALAIMCQVRAGQINMCDSIDEICTNLYKHRTNVLEDTKYLADIYRTVLFYAQGILCSGTTSFNGETVTANQAVASSILQPVPQSPLSITSPAKSKHHKFSKESFEEMKQSPGLKTGDMKDPLNFLDPLWSLKKK